MCSCKRSTTGSPPCLRYRQTECAEAQCAHTSAHATNSVEMQQALRCVRKIVPGVKNPAQGTQPSDSWNNNPRLSSEHSSWEASPSTAEVLPHLAPRHRLQGSEGCSQPSSAHWTCARAFSPAVPHPTPSSTGCHRERAQKNFVVLLSGAEQGTSSSSWGSLKNSRVGRGFLPRGISLFKSSGTQLNFVCVAEKVGFHFKQAFPFHCKHLSFLFLSPPECHPELRAALLPQAWGCSPLFLS